MDEVVGEILPGRSVLQVFRAASDDLCAVAPLIATYGAAPKSSTALFEIFRFDGVGRIAAWLVRRPRYLASVAALAWPVVRLARLLFGLATRQSAGRDFMDWPIVRMLLEPLASTQVRLDCIYDNEFVEFYFPTEHRSKGRHYLLRITSRDSRPGDAFTVYVSGGPGRIDGHVWRPPTRPAAANLGLVARVAYAPEVSSDKVPPSLEISPVAQCNLNCIHCISRPTRETRTRLDPRIRDDIRRWARSGDLKTAYTDFSGDVFWADKRFGGELDFLTGLDVPFHIDTNGVEIDADSADLVFRSKVTSINVSIDAACTATYQRVRRGAPPIETIIEKMKLLVERRAANRRPDVQLSAAFVLMRSTVDEFPEFVRLVHRVGFDAARASHLQVYTPDLHDESLWWDKPRFNAIQASAVQIAHELGVRLYIDRAFEDRREHPGTAFCNLPWQASYVLANGDVLACCVPGLKMGNLHEQSMEEIWNGPNYRELRRTVNTASRPPTCVACPFHRKMNNPQSFLQYLSVGPKPSTDGRAVVRLTARRGTRIP